MLFLWAEWCGDCKDQAADFRRTVEKYAPRGVLFAAPTRFYTEDHAAEKLRLDQVWKEVYGAPTGVSIPIADEAMLRYGVSSTPTFAMIDKAGVVRFYSPTRMTEQRLGVEIEKLLRP